MTAPTAPAPTAPAPTAPAPTAPARRADPWGRFRALAGSTRSAGELLAAALDQPVDVERVPVEDPSVVDSITPDLSAGDALVPGASAGYTPDGRAVGLLGAVGRRSSRWAAGAPVWAAAHLLRDSRGSHPALGYSCALISWRMLPVPVRIVAARHANTIAQVLEGSGAPWNAHTITIEELRAADAGWPVTCPPQTPMLRISRLLYLGGDLVALLFEEAVLPDNVPAPVPPSVAAPSVAPVGRDPPGSRSAR